MLKGLDITQKIEVVSDYDKSEPKTTFLIKPLSGLDMFSGEDINVKTILLKSVVEIKNFKGKGSIEDILSSLPRKVITELIVKINEINTITDDDQKN